MKHVYMRMLQAPVVAIALLSLALTEAKAQHWNPIGPKLSGDIYSLEVHENKLWIGGNFVAASTDTTTGLMTYDGQDFETYRIDEFAGFGLFDLHVHNGDLFAAGNYIVGSQNIITKMVGKWNGTTLEGQAYKLSENVNALETHNGQLFAGGRFKQNYPFVARHSGGANFILGGFLWNDVTTLKSLNGKLYAGGRFLNAGQTGQIARHAAQWDGADWIPVGKGLDETVFKLIEWDSTLIALGAFKQAGDTDANGVGRWNGTKWQALDLGAYHSTGPVLIRAGEVYNDDLVVGGFFDLAGSDSTLCGNIARYDGSKWQNFGWIPIDVRAIRMFDGKLYAGGIDPSGVSRIYVFDSSPNAVRPEEQQLDIAFYPNPTDGMVHIDFAGQGELYLALFDLSGRIQGRYILPSGDRQLDFRHLSNGQYIWMAKDIQGRSRSGQIVISK